jgi:hypothetical protein
MALQTIQVVTILYQVVVAIKEASFRCDVLSSFSPISLHDLLCATSDGFRS